ncbi:MAG: hypothetical protein HQK86_13790 [Nitrospinae bacterium]|nr:hypothetical protein [Nitrospinota bacterium]
MADDKYYDYSKLKTVTSYKPGKSSPTQFTRDTRSQKADESAAQRKSDLAQVRSSTSKAQQLSAARQVIAQSPVQALTSGAGNLDSVLNNAVGYKISKKA